MFRIIINKLFEWLLSRVLASHRGGPIPGREMSPDLFRIAQGEERLRERQGKEGAVIAEGEGRLDPNKTTVKKK
jgi:hypothetical protein